MENFQLDTSIYSFIIDKSNVDKAFVYKDIFNSIDEINACPFIINKLDSSYLERELLDVVVNYYTDDDAMFLLDSKIKTLIREMLIQNNITLAEDIPLYILSDILESYQLLFNTDPSLAPGFLDIAKGVENEDPTFTFIKLLNEYSGVGYGNLIHYVLEVDVDIINDLIKLYEEWENDTPEKIAQSYVRNISLFSIRYHINMFSSKHLLTILKNNKIFNASFKDIFPYINNIINTSQELGQEEYIDLITLGFLASKEGYNNINTVSDVLQEFGLLIFNDMDPRYIIDMIKRKIQEVKK